MVEWCGCSGNPWACACDQDVVCVPHVSQVYQLNKATAAPAAPGTHAILSHVAHVCWAFLGKGGPLVVQVLQLDCSWGGPVVQCVLRQQTTLDLVL
jgi:hypothetical protein